jgi:hypothetical protein
VNKPVLHSAGCRAEIADRECVRVVRWVLSGMTTPLLCWVCAHLAAGVLKEAKETAFLMGGEE